jgi:hypothetical protein
LTFDILEARAVPASRVVETLWDPGDAGNPDAMTLRRAIEEINSMAEPSNSIIFDSSLSGAVWLSSALPPLMVPMSIDGDTASGRVTVIRDDSPEANMPHFRIFEVMAFLDLSNMVVMGGRQGFGGGISIGSGATAYLTNVLVSANKADDGFFGGIGGGIHNDGTLVVTASTITSNWASGMGGGIHNAALASLTVQNGSVVASNQAWSFGGGISNAMDGNVQVMMSEIEYNWAGDVGAGFEGFGGGIYNAGTLDMSDSTLHGNAVLFSVVTGCQGGGLYCEGGSSATLSYVTITVGPPV